MTNRTPKGYVPILVGKGATMERFLLHVELFSDPGIIVLLEMAADELGYKQDGILRIPCDVDHFRQVLGAISKTNLPVFSFRLLLASCFS